MFIDSGDAKLCAVSSGATGPLPIVPTVTRPVAVAKAITDFLIDHD